MKLNQRDKILNYLKEFGSITAYESFIDLGITQLSTRLSELEDRGYKFKKEWVSKKNRYGNPVSFKKYMLEDR